jgi:hypothetical protein
LAEHDAMNIIASAIFISTGGMGKKDHEWVSNADWQVWTRDVQQTGLQIRADVKAKDLRKLAEAENHQVYVCQSCRDQYRLEIPSDGIMRFPFYPARALKKQALKKAHLAGRNVLRASPGVLRWFFCPSGRADGP